MSKLLQNAVKCLSCNTILKSLHVHDYQQCDCDNKTMVDGGLDYIRYGGTDMKSIELLTLYNTINEDEMVSNLLWGTYGINGDQPLKYVRLKDCETSHLKAILTNCRNIPDYVRNVINIILEKRRLNLI